MSDDVQQVDTVQVCNDYVAVLRRLPKTDIEIDEKSKQEVNEGYIVGIGDKVESSKMELGNVCIFQRKKYMAVAPKSGGYNGETILICREMDIVVSRKPKDGEAVINCA